MGMIVALASVMLLHAFRPYADRADQFFALAVSWQLVLVIFSGIVMGLNAANQDEAAREQYALLLCGLVVGTVMIGLVLVTREFRPSQGERFGDESKADEDEGVLVTQGEKSGGDEAHREGEETTPKLVPPESANALGRDSHSHDHHSHHFRKSHHDHQKSDHKKRHHHKRTHHHTDAVACSTLRVLIEEEGEVGFSLTSRGMLLPAAPSIPNTDPS